MCLVAHKKTGGKNEFSHLFGHFWSRLRNRRGSSSASSRQRLGHGGGAVVGPNVGFLVRNLRSGFVVCLGFSAGSADPGMKQVPSHKRAVGRTTTRVEDTSVSSSSSLKCDSRRTRHSSGPRPARARAASAELQSLGFFRPIDEFVTE